MTTATPPTNPPRRTGVPFPPPLVYAAGLVLGGLQSIFAPLQILPPVLAYGVGGLLAIGGLTLAAAAIFTFRRHQTTVNPFGGTTALCEDGPYRFTRNPMYLAMAVGYLGAALLMQSWLALLLLPGVIVLVDRFVIRREEAFLRGLFGEPYASYCGRVRRWL